LAAAPALGAETTTVSAPTATETIDTRELVRMLREQDRQIQVLEAECHDLAERLVAFQAELLKWVELDR